MRGVAGVAEVAVQVPTGELRALSVGRVFVAGADVPGAVHHLPDAAKVVAGVVEVES